MRYLKHSANVYSRFFQSAVEQRSRKVDSPQCLVAMENGCHGNDAIGVNVGVGKSEMSQCSIDLTTQKKQYEYKITKKATFQENSNNMFLARHKNG